MPTHLSKSRLYTYEQLDTVVCQHMSGQLSCRCMFRLYIFICLILCQTIGLMTCQTISYDLYGIINFVRLYFRTLPVHMSEKCKLIRQGPMICWRCWVDISTCFRSSHTLSVSDNSRMHALSFWAHRYIYIYSRRTNQIICQRKCLHSCQATQ